MNGLAIDRMFIPYYIWRSCQDPGYVVNSQMATTILVEEGDSSSDEVASESPIKHSRCEYSTGAASNLFDDYGQFLTLAANPITALEMRQ